MATNKELETGLVNGGTTYNQLLEILNGLWGISELNGWTVLRLGSKYTRYEMYAKAGTHILPVKFKETTIAYCAYTDGTVGSKVVKINDKVITVLKDCRIEITQISKGVLKDGGEGGRGEGGTISPEQQKLDEIWDAIHALQNQTASIATLRAMIEAEISARQSEFAQLTNSISSLDTRLNRVNEELQSKVDLDTYSNFKQSTNNTLADHEQHLTDIDTKNDEQDTTLAEHASHLETIDGHLDTIDSHLDTIDGHLDAIDAKNDEQDQTLSSHTQTLSEHSTHLTNIDTHLTQIDAKDATQDSRLDALEAKPDVAVAGVSNETVVTNATSGGVKTYTVGLATDIKNKVSTAYNHSQSQGNPHNTTIGDINGLQTELTSIESDITAIEAVIPDEATASNQLADKAFVNSSITTNTATFRGTSAKNLTEAQFLAWANTLSKTKNDYVFWDTIDTDGNVVFKRYKYDGSNWIYEYSLNNSSFTASQWASINSGIVSGDVSDLHTHLTDNTRHITAAERTTWNSKASDTALQNEITNRTNADSALGTRIDGVISDLSSHTSNTTVHITAAERTSWNAKATPSDITNAINALDVSDSAVTNQFVTKVSETDGKISVSRAQPQISDVKDLQTELNKKIPIRNSPSEITSSTNMQCWIAKHYTSAYMVLYDVTSAFDGTYATASYDTDHVSFAGFIQSCKYNGYGENRLFKVECKINSKYPSNYNYSSDYDYGPVVLKRTYTEGGVEKNGYYLAIKVPANFNFGIMVYGQFHWQASVIPTTSWKDGVSGKFVETTDTEYTVYWNFTAGYNFAKKATQLETARTIRTNLASTATASFDGTANITPGVTGTLPIANGGTGATTTAGAQFNLFPALKTQLGDASDTVRIPIIDGNGSSSVATFAGYRTGLQIWNYIKSKIKSVLGLDATNYDGTAAKATADASGNTITTTYATKTELNTKQYFTRTKSEISTALSSINTTNYLRCSYFLDNTKGIGSYTTGNSIILILYDVSSFTNDGLQNSGDWCFFRGFANLGYVAGLGYESVSKVIAGMHYTSSNRELNSDDNLVRPMIVTAKYDDTANGIITGHRYLAIHINHTQRSYGNKEFLIEGVFGSKISNASYYHKGFIGLNYFYGSATETYWDTYAATQSFVGNVATANKLFTSRELAVDLSNTSTTTNFDGGANVTNIKISNTLPITHGGTGATSAPDARTNLDVYSKSEVSTTYATKSELSTKEPSFSITYNSTTKRLKTTKSINII